MKKIMTITAITGGILLMSALGMVAAVPTHVQAATENAKKEMAKNIYTAKVAIKGDAPAEIKATVQVDKNGKVSVQNITSSNQKLKQYVVYQLEKMTLERVNTPGTFVLLIQFVSES